MTGPVPLSPRSLPAEVDSPPSRLDFRHSLLFFAISFLVLTTPPLAQSDYDVLIRNVRVVDGTGNPWFHASVGIRGDRIAAIGRLAGATARLNIDGQGQLLTPGFIDIHTHVERSEFRPGIEGIPGADNFLLDGVTTIVTGNCGGSQANLTRWFLELEQLPLGLNVASLVGHNTVRRSVMGSANRSATAAEINQMQELIGEAMEAGAVGFSTGLLYVPGTYADTQEVISLARVAAQYDGVYSSHIRNQAEGLLESITEAVTVGREAGLPVQISHLKVKGKKLWGTISESLALIDSFRQQGVDVVVDAYPYERASTNLSVNLPRWALADGNEALRKRLADVQTRKRIKEGMQEILEELGFRNYAFATVASYPRNPDWEGKTISHISRLRGQPDTTDAEMETILEMMSQGGAGMVYHYMSLEDVAAILKYPNTAVASDGGVRRPGAGKPHPRSYGTNARFLATYVRKQKLLTLEDAVRRMTSLPARTFGFHERGLVREGYLADLVLFDPDRVQDRATYQQPHQYSEGFDYVLVNGVPVVAGEELTESRPGRVLRHQGR